LLLPGRLGIPAILLLGFNSISFEPVDFEAVIFSRSSQM
jgi:hypothetical protein